MEAYAQSATCRWKLLLDYFGETDGVEACGECDNCRNPLEAQHAPPIDEEARRQARLKPAV
jgi:ATP-dependent DNA helicase RecQ